MEERERESFERGDNSETRRDRKREDGTRLKSRRETQRRTTWQQYRRDKQDGWGQKRKERGGREREGGYNTAWGRERNLKCHWSRPLPLSYGNPQLRCYFETVLRVIVKRKVNYTPTKGKKKYFTVKHLCAHAQTRERERERERERRETETDRERAQRVTMTE